MRTTTNFSFYCRKSKIGRNGQSPLELSIIINGTRKFINLPHRFNPDEFAKKRKPAHIQEVLNLWRNKIDEILLNIIKQGIPLTADTMRQYIRTGGVPSYTIETLFNDYLSILKKRVGVDLSECAYVKYKRVANMFMNSVDKDKECSYITNAAVLEFYATLNAKYDLSTSAGYMTKLKTFVKFGIDNGKITINPFQGVKINKGKKEIEYLVEEEVQKIVNAHFDNDSLENVRKCFTVMLATGLAYSDLANLTKDDIQEKEGVFYIKKCRRKTDTEYTSVILPFGVELFNEGFRVLSNQKLNYVLKMIGGLLGIKTVLKCHLARKTYGQLLLSRGVRLEVVSRALGHSNTKITEKYYCKARMGDIINEISSVF